MEKLWKICEICNGTFEASRTTQRFCTTCGKDSAQARKRLERAEQINRHKVDDWYSTPKKAVCNECGKEFFAIHSQSYCSSLCQYTARVKKTNCPVCGKNLFDLGIESVKDIPCSPECRTVRDIREAKKSGRYRTCLQCGKEFIAFDAKGKFCCRDCFLTYTKMHKNQKDKTRYAKEQLDASCKKTCRYCGGSYALSDSWQSEIFCSPMCRDKAKPKVIRHIPPCRALEKSRTEPKKTELKESVPQPLHLCTTCRTSQSQCERFTSQFVYFPKGAVVKKADGKLIVVSCPRFSAAATKKKNFAWCYIKKKYKLKVNFSYSIPFFHPASLSILFNCSSYIFSYSFGDRYPQ